MLSDDKDEVVGFDFTGTVFNLQALSIILSILNRDGEIVVKGVLPGSVDMLSLGASLSRMADSGTIESAVAAVLATENANSSS